MILLKFLLEIVVFLLLFVIFRQAVIKSFPVKSIGMPLSDQSRVALQRFRNRYILLFILFSTLFTAVVWWLLFRLLVGFQTRNGALVLIVDNMALLLPSLIIGLLLGTFIGRWANHKLQRDGLSFFFEGYTDELEGFNWLRLSKWLVAVSLVFALFLIIGQFHYRLKIKEGQLYIKTSVFEPEKSFTLNRVSIHPDSNSRNNFVIYTPADTLYTNNFGGDKKAFVQAIKKAGRTE